MKKGFTLIEVLGVVVLLSIIILLITPNIISSIRNANSNVNNKMADIIFSATRKYIENDNEYKKKKGNTYCIDISELVNNNYLESPVKYGDYDDITEIKTVKAEYNTNWNYSIVDSENCTSNVETICTRVDTNTVTDGFIPIGNYEPGDEYICKLDSITTEHFYIIGMVGNKVNLIASKNIDTDGEFKNTTGITGWSTSTTNSSGPTGSYNSLEIATSAWTKIPTIKYFEYIDNLTNTYGYTSINTKFDSSTYITTIKAKDNTVIRYGNLRSRLPIASELMKLGCKTTNNSCPKYLSSNISSSTDVGYWLTDSANNSNKAKYINYNKAIAEIAVNNNTIGIRPVIEITKSELE